MTNDKDIAQREHDLALAKSLVRDWLMERGVALTGVNGETSRSTIHRFKLELASRIRAALTTTRLEAVRDTWKRAIRIAKEEAFERRTAHTVYERLIEAAANTAEEGAGDADIS